MATVLLCSLLRYIVPMSNILYGLMFQFCFILLWVSTLQSPWSKTMRGFIESQPFKKRKKWLNLDQGTQALTKWLYRPTRWVPGHRFHPKRKSSEAFSSSLKPPLSPLDTTLGVGKSVKGPDLVLGKSRFTRWATNGQLVAYSFSWKCYGNWKFHFFGVEPSKLVF